MAIMSFLSIFSLFFTGFLGIIPEYNIKNIDFNNQEISINGFVDYNFSKDEFSYKTNFNIEGIHNENSSKYNVHVDSPDEKFNLKYFSDKDGYYFDTNSLKDIAQERANDNLKKIYSEYIKVDKNTIFGFTTRYPINLIDDYLKYSANSNSVDTFLSISKKLSDLKLNTRLVKKENKYILYINMDDIVKDISTISKYILDNYDIFSKDIDTMSKDLNMPSKDIKKFLINMQDESYFKDFLNLFNGTNFMLTFYRDEDMKTNNLFINSDITFGNKEEYMNVISKFKISFKNTEDKVLLPTTFTNVSEDEYSTFYLPSISDLCHIVKVDENNKYQEVYFKKFPVMYENTLYVDETVIKQFADEVEFFRDHIEFVKNNKRLYVYPDYYVMGDKVFTKKISMLPIRPIVEFFGYSIDFERDDSGFFNIKVR